MLRLTQGLGALALACSIGFSARAADITYHGRQSADGVVADYTFVSDGTLGKLQRNHIESFSVNFSYGDTRDHFDQSSKGIFFENYALDFQPDAIVIHDDEGLTNISFSDTGRDFGDVIHIESPGTQDFQIAVGDDYQVARIHNDPIFATEVSAAPEPGAWALMFAGIAIMGAVLRRRRQGVALPT